MFRGRFLDTFVEVHHGLLEIRELLAVAVVCVALRGGGCERVVAGGFWHVGVGIAVLLGRYVVLVDRILM